MSIEIYLNYYIKLQTIEVYIRGSVIIFVFAFYFDYVLSISLNYLWVNGYIDLDDIFILYICLSIESIF